MADGDSAHLLRVVTADDLRQLTDRMVARAHKTGDADDTLAAELLSHLVMIGHIPVDGLSVQPLPAKPKEPPAGGHRDDSGFNRASHAS